jgi:hypothetical protein
MVSSTSMLRASELFLAVGLTISSLELFSVCDSLRDSGLLAWRVQRLRHPLMATLISRCGLDVFFRYPGVLALMTIRLLSALCLAGSIIQGYPTFWFLVLAAGTTFLMVIRNPLGNDGADQMSSITLVAAALAEGIGTEFARSAALVFIAGQASLAYCTSGALKLTKRGWRNGTFVMDILRTSSFGSRRILEYVHDGSRLSVVAGWTVCVGDCALGVCMFSPPRYCKLVLLFGVLLHLGVATIMGLNTFVWSFIGAYPGIFWASLLVYQVC